MTGVLIQREGMDTEGARERQIDKRTDMQGCAERHGEKMAVYMGCLHHIYNPAEARGGPFPHSPRKEPALLTPWLWTSSLPNCEAIHF